MDQGPLSPIEQLACDRYLDGVLDYLRLRHLTPAIVRRRLGIEGDVWVEPVSPKPAASEAASPDSESVLDSLKTA